MTFMSILIGTYELHAEVEQKTKATKLAVEQRFIMKANSKLKFYVFKT